MERRGTAVGVLATLSVALAGGALASSTPATSGGVGVGVGGVGSAARVLGGVLWLVASGALVAGGVWVAIDRLRGARDVELSTSRVVAVVVAVVAAIAGVLAVAVRVFEDGEGPRRQEGVGGPLLRGAPEGSSATGGPGPALVLGILVLLVLAVLAYRHLGREREVSGAQLDSSESDGEDAATADAEGLGPAAGRAADHLTGSDATPENDVVRAWRELATVLPLPRPASSTPREFAEAAVDAGVDEDDVAELTALFEAVRYGDRDADWERTRRAVAALERIEDAVEDDRDDCDDRDDRDDCDDHDDRDDHDDTDGHEVREA